ncbi:hypothetical protein G5C66_15835 [Nocardioides sp. KC13]|uniref:Uncharacterized protein n=1 Tax=Nocardioides turkmenicus TaxID=2711220 RepID=A0A6M1QW73_9ACTN|nr:hypothetical protein [Nocardioides sp. KC13]NGN94203.1 hypothetical protein [Nocardioides sp. KC13]
MANTSEPVTSVERTVATQDHRLRATQAVGALILLVVSLSAPVLVSIDDSTGQDHRDVKAIWSGLAYGKVLVSNPDADFGSHTSHVVVFAGLILTVILCLVMLLGALSVLVPLSTKPRRFWSAASIATALAPMVTLVGLGLSSGESELAATWTTLAPTALGLWVLAATMDHSAS